VVICVVLWSSPAEAIKWDFDDGTTQGWTTKEALTWGGTREFHQFPGMVEDGVWRIRVDPSITNSLYASSPGVELISSTIGYDSGLFDQVRVRFRTVHNRPTEGAFSIEWENSSGFYTNFDIDVDPEEIIEQLVYTTEWQEMVLSLAGHRRWEGLLKNIRLSFILDFGEDTEPGVVESFEIDWIELTGVEELIEGELPPPPVEYYFGFAGTGLFAPPIFYPIAPGIGEVLLGEGYLGEKSRGVLTDLDGDGDLDLFGLWETQTEIPQGREEKSGWLMAVNDGRGALERGPVIEEVSATGWVVLDMLGADLTGDGKDEIAISRSNREPRTEVWSINPKLEVEVLAQIDQSIHSVADWDGDGRVELLVGGTTYEGSLEEAIAGTAEFFSTLAVWEVEQGVWTSEEVPASKDYFPLHIGDFTSDGTLDVFWTPIRGESRGIYTWFVGALGEESQSGEIFEFDKHTEQLGVGDFDGDGQVDFLTEFSSDLIEGSKGIVLQRKGAGARLEAEVLYDDRLLRRSPVLVRDLDADGVDDWVFIGGDRASGFGVFVEWGGSVNPTQEGERYRLEGAGRYVLSGDMDNDGDVDLVVLDSILGGVHLLKSSLSEQPTAVLTPAAARPVQYRLGDSYPNPFNPAVVIPLDLATDAAGALTVYDVLGRRVRQVWQGPLRAGSHRFVWDGRDEAGKAVAAGVYIYKVEIDGQMEAKKTTKLP
ncbi:MAG: T9SS type A sorting domain-containing protein, partial [Gemmatimonadota bacterium]|nr:T9SS type A sorting domain-containing protein [Gemmatimonadota bacterium]